jgi:hypothetical protein
MWAENPMVQREGGPKDYEYFLQNGLERFDKKLHPVPSLVLSLQNLVVR